MEPQASLIEIFSSLQGEGPRLGERHLFIRFQDCELSCKFCDTPLSFVENRFCRVESPPFSKKFRHLSNPLTASQLTNLLSDFHENILVLTGGEPLQKSSFLKEWLPQVSPRFKILLETAGIHVNEFKDIAEWIDIVSMDLKLPSSTGMHPWWREHEAFLKAVQDKDVYVKIIVTSETTEEDMVKAVHLVKSINEKTPFIIQPASAFGRFRATPSLEQISHWQEMVLEKLEDVRVIPQMHKVLGIL